MPSAIRCCPIRMRAASSPLQGTMFLSEDSMTHALTRRAALLGSVALAGFTAAAAKRNLKVAIFSKHLQFLRGAELARAAGEIGFNGIDLTVRAGGHVEPARAAED